MLTIQINDLKARVLDFLTSSGVPVTRMCERIDLSTSSYYKWQRNELELSEGKLATIEQYLSQFGF